VKENRPHDERQAPRLLLLAGKLGYQTHTFLEAAKRTGAEVIIGSDRCHQLEDPWSDGAIAMHFEEPEDAAKAALKRLGDKKLDGVLALGDRPTETAAYVAKSLGIPYNTPESVRNCRSKFRQRELMRAANLPMPEFFSFAFSEPIDQVQKRVEFPCVVKPLSLSGSQGVIRANNAHEFSIAVQRIRRLLDSPELRVNHEPALDRLLVEKYIFGQEVAVEGLLEKGKLRILAIFDKPDPLDGPFFEETIYVTPSRMSARVQRSIAGAAQATADALGLTEGPFHAEFRIEEKTREPWPLEASARPIGGLCAKTLRFGIGHIPLEELLVRHALGLSGGDAVREDPAAGVMMIPVPITGVFEKVEGIERAQSVPDVEDIEITARKHDVVHAWPEGSSYLGFIFARGERPEKVERALRRAHVLLRFTFGLSLPAEHPVTRAIPATA
jgi:biotin carboxylase